MNRKIFLTISSHKNSKTTHFYFNSIITRPHVTQSPFSLPMPPKWVTKHQHTITLPFSNIKNIHEIFTASLVHQSPVSRLIYTLHQVTLHRIFLTSRSTQSSPAISLAFSRVCFHPRYYSKTTPAGGNLNLTSRNEWLWQVSARPSEFSVFSTPVLYG